MHSLESPHGGDSDEYTQYTIFNMKTKITLNYPKPAAMRFFQGTQERVRNSRGKRAISVRATEALLYNFSQNFSGRFINVTSVKGRIANTLDTAYAMTKWAGEAFSDILRREMGRFGVKVIIMEPGDFGGLTGMGNPAAVRIRCVLSFL